MVKRLQQKPVKSFANLRREGGIRSSAPVGSTFIALADINRFLPLRGRIGYTRANAVMIALGEQITRVLPHVTIGRIGRNTIEFAFVAANRDHAEALLQSVGAAIEQPIEVDGFEFTMSAVIGAADLGDGPLLDASVDLAAAAAGEAKRVYQRVKIADPKNQAGHGVDELALLREMPEAMRSGALQVHYQPKFRLRSNEIDAAEALIRWKHPIIGAVPIEPFVRLVEDTGAIRRLTEWVIARAVMDQAIIAAGGHDLILWVNLSGLLLADSLFTVRALELLAGAGHRIGLEITETAVIGDPERAMANLAAFAAEGVKIAIDDYGSGLSSLAYLKQLPAQELKIDRLFIKELIDSHLDPLLVRSSIDLAHALDMEVTAEGVDNPMALALLRIMGCDLVQGYLISPAVPVRELQRLLADHKQIARITTPTNADSWKMVVAKA